MPYSSPLPPPTEPVRVAVIHCSDGRYTDHCADFVHNELDVHAADLIALPGGPASIAEHPAMHVKADRVIAELKFLADAHSLERVVLIAHQGCGFYAAATGGSDALFEAHQKNDIQAAARRITAETGIEAVEAWFLRVDDGQVSFVEFGLV